LLKTLQIATAGSNTDSVLVGIRSLPAHKLALICLPKDKEAIDSFASVIERTLKMPIETYAIRGNPIEGVLETVAAILKKERDKFDDVVFNVAGGEKVLTCAAVSAAFINGLKAFHIMDEMLVMLPVLKLSYDRIISKAKKDVLRFIDKAGGVVESLEQLKKISGYGKPLLSHHIRGAEDSRGLEELGLVETERVKRGRIRVQLTLLGKILLLSES
jgi:DNA-binding transcriptional ArsR family regulator